MTLIIIILRPVRIWPKKENGSTKTVTAQKSRWCTWYLKLYLPILSLSFAYMFVYVSWPPYLFCSGLRALARSRKIPRTRSASYFTFIYAWEGGDEAWKYVDQTDGTCFTSKWRCVRLIQFISLAFQLYAMTRSVTANVHFLCLFKLALPTVVISNSLE